MLPKVTTDINEYYKTSGGLIEELSPTTMGYYCNGHIWVRKLSPSTLAHEFTHHVFNSIGNGNGGTRFFLDMIDSIQQSAHHLIKYRKLMDTERKRYYIDMIKDCIRDWLNWMLCRDVG